MSTAWFWFDPTLLESLKALQHHCRLGSNQCGTYFRVRGIALADEMTVLVGTVGQGIMRSPDGGETWQRLSVNQGMYQNPMVRVMASHPMSPDVVYAGTEKGLFKSDDAGQNWRHVDSPLSES